MGTSNIDKDKKPVAYARERFFEKLRNWKPSPELEEAIKQKKPIEEDKKPAEEPKKKIAGPPKSRNDLDL